MAELFRRDIALPRFGGAGFGIDAHGSLGEAAEGMAIDFFIVLTLLLPTALANLGFLRILRLWLMSRSGFLWRPLEHRGLGHGGTGDMPS